MEKSANCLRQSIDGESTAVVMYTDFAGVAENEGYPNIANLFTCLAYAEKVHIKNHMSALQQPDYTATIEKYEVAGTIENIKSAIDGETYECKVMYPKFFKEIKKEQNTDYGKVAMLSMQWSSSVELNHAKILKQALKGIEKGNNFEYANIYICDVCGNIEIGQPTKACNVCGHDASFFTLVKKED